MSQIPCFVVNLATATKRRAAMQSMLTERGITPTWFEAVDGRILSESELATHFNAARATIEYGPMARAEVGAALSHLGIYRQMVEQNILCAVILEDDVILEKDFKEMLRSEGQQTLASTFPSTEPVMVQLTHVERGYRAGTIEFGNRQIVRPHSGVWLCAAYFITQAAAKKMLEALYPVWMVADHWSLFESQGLVTLHAMTPNVAWESADSQASDIEATRSSRRKSRKTIAERFRRMVDAAFVRPFRVRDLPRNTGQG